MGSGRVGVEEWGVGELDWKSRSERASVEEWECMRMVEWELYCQSP